MKTGQDGHSRPEGAQCKMETMRVLDKTWVPKCRGAVVPRAERLEPGADAAGYHTHPASRAAEDGIAVGSRPLFEGGGLSAGLHE